MIKNKKNFLIQTLKILFAVALIYWLVTSGKLNFTALGRMLTPAYAILGLGLVFFNFYFASERWRVLVLSQRIQANSWPTFKLSMIGAFFNFAMPGGVGGDVVKAYYFAKENPGSRVTAATSVLMDRVLGLFAMVIMALVVMLYDLDHVWNEGTLRTLFYVIVALFLAFTVGLALVFSGTLYEKGLLKALLSKLPLGEKLNKLYESMHLYGKNLRRILLILLLSVISQTCCIFFLILAGYAAGFADVPVKTYFLVAPLGFMATAIPISPAGVGVGQAAFYFLFNKYIGHKSDLGPTVITAYQIGTFALSMIGAFYYMRRKDTEGDAIRDLAQS